MADQQRPPIKRARKEPAIADDEGDANDEGTESDLFRKRREKESLILKELSATIATLQDLSNVLGDIVQQTTTIRKRAAGADTRKVVVKQKMLLEELQQWKHLLPSADLKDVL
ncbi:expressed unknown protein [Seminavis robusta]|uniref:Uncharacterized protein n=1 Tax=Seminavis robusta TaxID=568900 RepID=A0A9N8DX08_9STRA|nr:expressed unknown protein [Seminavis robusta]|eukprot:Sro357_g125610.1 n/a (113) ;mRNA; f:29886-30224